MSVITTHVLDTSRGLPAPGIRVKLEIQFPDGAWEPLGKELKELTDADGRARNLLPPDTALIARVYRLTCDNLPEGLYPEVSVTFRVGDSWRRFGRPQALFMRALALLQELAQRHESNSLLSLRTRHWREYVHQGCFDLRLLPRGHRE